MFRSLVVTSALVLGTIPAVAGSRLSISQIPTLSPARAKVFGLSGALVGGGSYKIEYIPKYDSAARRRPSYVTLTADKIAPDAKPVDVLAACGFRKSSLRPAGKKFKWSGQTYDSSQTKFRYPGFEAFSIEVTGKRVLILSTTYNGP